MGAGWEFYSADFYRGKYLQYLCTAAPIYNAYTNGLNSQDYDFIIKCIVLMIDVTNDWLKVKE